MKITKTTNLLDFINLSVETKKPIEIKFTADGFVDITYESKESTFSKEFILQQIRKAMKKYNIKSEDL